MSLLNFENHGGVGYDILYTFLLGNDIYLQEFHKHGACYHAHFLHLRPFLFLLAFR
jgi:hypothetical protein